MRNGFNSSSTFVTAGYLQTCKRVVTVSTYTLLGDYEFEFV